MIFKYIEIQGFLSFYQKTVIPFADTTTIIIGQNNTGKSKLFDAFNWVLYEKIFITERERWVEGADRDKNEISTAVLNRRVRKEGIQNNTEHVEAACKLVLEDDDGDEIHIERKYIYKKNDSEYILESPKILVHQIDLGDGSIKDTFYGSSAENIISEYMPRKLSKYCLFQGETVSEIMNLNNKSHFQNAIKELARLDIYDKATRCAKNLVDKYNRMIQSEYEKDSRTKAVQIQLSNSIDQAGKRIESLNKEIESLEDEESLLLTDIEKIQNELEIYEGFAQRFDDIEKKKKEYQQLKELSKNYPIELMRTQLSENWIFYLVKDKLSRFQEFYDKLAEKGDVPAPISQSIIKDSLKKGKCALCDRAIIEGSFEEKFLQQKVHNKDTDILGAKLHEIMVQLDTANLSINDIPLQISNESKEREDLEKKIKNTNEKIKEMSDELSAYSPDDLSSEKRLNVTLLTSKLSNKKNLLQRCRNSLSASKRVIEEKEHDIYEAQKQQKNNGSSVDTVLLDQKRNIANKVYITMKSLEDKINSTIYSDIQNRANDYFQEMTMNNQSMGGKIFLDKENSEVYTVNEEGDRITNINQANRVSIQLSFIAGVLTIASEQLGVNFPFIADAPTSALGGVNKIPAINSLINAFEQSIIILKDDAASEKDAPEDPVRKLINSNTSIQSAFEFKLSKESHTSDQFTQLYTLKGKK